MSSWQSSFFTKYVLDDYTIIATVLSVIFNKTQDSNLVEEPTDHAWQETGRKDEDGAVLIVVIVVFDKVYLLLEDIAVNNRLLIQPRNLSLKCYWLSFVGLFPAWGTQ